MSRVNTSDYLSFDGHETMTALWKNGCFREGFGDAVCVKKRVSVAEDNSVV